MIPVLKTSLPIYKSLQKYIEEIDLNSVYSNFGPLYCNLNQALSQRYEIDTENVCLLNSGTSGLIAAIYTISQRLGKRPFELTVALPAWSFVATAQAPLSLGCRLKYVDVDNEGFAKPPQDLVADILIVVSPFGQPIDSEFWLQYEQQTGISLLFDCAACFSTLIPSSIPSVVSCHATKSFSTGEGGFVACKDIDFIRSVKTFSNFGFASSRHTSSPGINLKLSEINCAYGLTILDNPTYYFKPYCDQIELYNKLLKDHHAVVQPFNSSFLRTTYNIRITLSGYSRQNLLFTLMDSYAIECRSWWGNPLPRTLVYSSSLNPPDSLFPFASYLSNNIIGLPMGIHINPSIQQYVVDSLLNILSKPFDNAFHSRC